MRGCFLPSGLESREKVVTSQYADVSTGVYARITCSFSGKKGVVWFTKEFD